ncbi:MAG: hypothetical protein AAFY08_09130 [Planctomycetota bacterium]
MIARYSLRRYLTVCTAFVTLGGVALPTLAEPKHLLYFGNSFSSRGNFVGNMVRELAIADGQLEPISHEDHENAKTVEFHLGQVLSNPQNNVTSDVLPLGTAWESLVIQGFSGEETVAEGDGSFVEDVVALYQAVADHPSGNASGVKMVLFQTWPRGPGNVKYTGSDPLYAGPEAMHAETQAAYNAAARALRSFGATVKIAPIGDAFLAAGFDVSLYDVDLHHASAKGYLLRTMVMYRTIYEGELLSDLVYQDLPDILQAQADADTWDELVAIADALTVPEPGLLSLLSLSLAVGLIRRG